MMDPVNAHCFDDPRWRLIARGFEPEKWLNDGVAEGTGGIFNPKPVKLPVGHFYRRFASSTSSLESWLGGGWWIDFDTYNNISAFARRNDYSIRDAARLMLALPYKWTRVDLIISAELVLPLKAYAGEGKPARGPDEGPDRGTLWIPTQHVKARQLYIPGLILRGTPESQQLYARAFKSVTAEVLR